MEKELWLPTLSHFQNDNGWSGSSGVLCYEIEKPKEETMTVVLWYGPFCRQYAEEMERRQYPVTEDGIEAMRAWLMERAAAMNAAPERTPADTLAWYQKTAAEKRAEKSERPIGPLTFSVHVDDADGAVLGGLSGTVLQPAVGLLVDLGQTVVADAEHLGAGGGAQAAADAARALNTDMHGKPSFRKLSCPEG